MAAARLAGAWDAARRTLSGATSQVTQISGSLRNQRANSEPQMSQAGAKPSNEPSMEDILASIRRIIAEDYPTQSGGAVHQPTSQAAESQMAPRVHPVANALHPAVQQPAAPQAQQDILDLNQRADRFRPPMPEVVTVSPPVQSQAPLPRAATRVPQADVEPVTVPAQSVEPELQGLAARAVSEFSERLGRSFAAAERYQRETQNVARAAQQAAAEPVMSATVEAVAAAVHSHLAAAQAVRVADPVRAPEPQKVPEAQRSAEPQRAPEPQRVPEPQRESNVSMRPEPQSMRHAIESRTPQSAREAYAPQPAPAAPSAKIAAAVMQNDPPPAWLVSPRTGSSVAGSFKALQDNKTVAAPLSEAHSSALQEVMTAALRPMLKDWLDQHLPGMVERMISAEIQRVTRGQ